MDTLTLDSIAFDNFEGADTDTLANTDGGNIAKGAAGAIIGGVHGA